MAKARRPNFLQNMARTLPPMMQVLKEVGGIELPETLMKMRGAEEAAKAPLASAAAVPGESQS